MAGPRAGRPERPERPLGEFREIARNRLIESRLTPNAISMTGLVLNLAAAVLILEDLFVLGAFAFIIGSVMDTLDGRYSRMSGKGTLFGAFLDSTLDRVSEGLMLGSLGLLFARQGHQLALASCFVALACSYLTSYTRAKAEALGVGRWEFATIRGPPR